MRRLRHDPAERFDAAALENVLAQIEIANGAAFDDDVAVVAVSAKQTDEALATA
jgi:hypothetical protein